LFKERPTLVQSVGQGQLFFNKCQITDFKKPRRFAATEEEKRDKNSKEVK
jgi:hypothetical protein